MALIETLLALLTVGVTIVIVIIGSLYRELISNIKPRVNSVYHIVVGNPDDRTDEGLVQDVEQVQDRMEENAEERRSEHEAVETKLSRLQRRVDSVVNAMERSDSVDVNVNASNSLEQDSDDD